MIFTANKFGYYTNGRFSIRCTFEGKWRAQHGRHLIGEFSGPHGLTEAQLACAKYKRDCKAACRAQLRRKLA